jgi:hypothetical protein
VADSQTGASAPSASPATPGSDNPLITPPSKTRRSRRRLAFDLSLLAIVGVVLVGAIAAAFGAVQREFYSPTAFVERYLDVLAEGRAADALSVPGVAVASADLEAAGLPATSHDALLRSAVLSELDDTEVISEVRNGDVVEVTVEYSAGGYEGTTTFEVVEDGMIGFAPTWRFATSPLAVMNLDVGGSMVFTVNGFEIDKRQVSPDGVAADPTAPVSLLVFSPGLYSVSVDGAIASTPGVAVLSDSPFTKVPVSIQAQPTAEFIDVLQDRVEEFLNTCATQEVLQPTACPFGYTVEDRIVGVPKWTIAEQPEVTALPDGANWRIPVTEAVAEIDVDIQSLYDGSITEVTDKVPFLITGNIRVLPDGSVTISVGGPEGQ